jgi:hypothetical protein
VKTELVAFAASIFNFQMDDTVLNLVNQPLEQQA